jgi:hypothetical protein
MILQCKSCGLTLGESFSHFTPIEVTCMFCIEEREYFKAYFANEPRKTMTRELEGPYFDRMGEVAEMRLKTSALYFGDKDEENASST